MSLKIFDKNDLPHELLLTARQKTKLRNAFIRICQLTRNFLKPKFLK